MTNSLEREFAHTEERLQSLARWLGRNGVLLPHGQDLDALEDLSAIRADLSSIERHVQDTRENIVLALPDHGGRCGGTDEKPAARDQSDRFSNPCIRCRVLLAFDAALSGDRLGKGQT